MYTRPNICNLAVRLCNPSTRCITTGRPNICSRSSSTNFNNSSFEGHASSRSPEQWLCSYAASHSQLTGQHSDVGVRHFAALLLPSGKQQGGVVQMQGPSMSWLQHSSLQVSAACLQCAVSAACLPQQQQANLQQLLPCWHRHTLRQVTVSRPKQPSLWQQQQPWRMEHSDLSLQQLRQYHAQQPQQPDKRQRATSNRVDPSNASQEQAAAAAERLPGSAFTTLPNMLSLSRVAMGPWLAYCIASQQWPVAVLLTAAAGVSACLENTTQPAAVLILANRSLTAGSSCCAVLPWYRCIKHAGVLTMLTVCSRLQLRRQQSGSCTTNLVTCPS
jgi:hypothetical protein